MFPGFALHLMMFSCISMLLSIEKRKVCVLSKSLGNVKGCELSKTYMLTISIPESYTKPYVGSDGSLPRKELNIIKEDYTAYFFKYSCKGNPFFN